jgi:lysozyme
LVDPAKLKAAGIKGLIHKCTQGIRYADPVFRARMDAVKKVGILRGAYHFATNDDPIAQVNWFLAHAQIDSDMLIALDWEGNPDGPDMSVAQARAFLTEIMRLTGRSPHGIVVYGGNVLKQQITTAEDIAFFGQFPLWLCQYGPRAVLPKAWNQFFLWQYSETGKVDGFNPDGHVDLNCYYGPDLDAEWVTEAAISAAGAPQIDISDSEPGPVVPPARIRAGETIPTVKAAAKSRTVRGIIGGFGLLVGNAFQRIVDGINWLFDQLPGISTDVQGLMQPITSITQTIGAHSRQIEIAAGTLCVFYAIMRAATDHQIRQEQKGT